MPTNTQMSYYSVTAQADALSALFDGAFLRIYDGAQPANADTAITTQSLLAELEFGTPAATPATDGVITFSAITGETSAVGTGAATWFRVVASDTTTVLMDGSVGTSDANLILTSVAISIGSTVTVTAFTHTVPRA